jgi:GTPase
MIDFDGGRPIGGYIVGVKRGSDALREAEDHLVELEQLTISYGIPVLGKELIQVRLPTATYLAGPGQVEAIARHAKEAGADVIVVDDELSPSQQRNWERTTELAVIDRREVILGIFADRAQTREARLQVQLARAEYSLPRLTRAWTHLERQRGGGGFRGGAGEAQLEVDRRLLGEQIQRLKRELKHVRQVRATQRKQRVSIPVPTAAIVGYTNAGKSSLLNALTGAGVLEEDRLFATLDPTTRKLDLPSGQTVLLSDTVGFVRKLPHTLVEAFKATLEEAQVADFLLHVVDANHHNALEHRQATEAVLEELGIRNKPTILVLNKMDGVEDRFQLENLREGYEAAAMTSTVTREGLDVLMDAIGAFAGRDLLTLDLRVPAARYDVVSLIHREGEVISEEQDGEITVLRARVPNRLMGRVSDFLTGEND